jgi:hypothetical protein
MGRYLHIFISFFLFILPTQAQAQDPSIYAATCLTGGQYCLDAIDVYFPDTYNLTIQLQDGDMATVISATDGAYNYVYDYDSGASESSPTIIKPDYYQDGAYSGAGRWILVSFTATEITSNSAESLNGKYACSLSAAVTAIEATTTDTTLNVDCAASIAATGTVTTAYTNLIITPAASITLGDDATLTTGGGLEFKPGAGLISGFDGGESLAINGSFLCSKDQQAFDIANLAVTGLKIPASVEWFGCDNGGIADCTDEITALFVAADVWQVNTGTYDHTGITLYTDKSILGLGQNVSELNYTEATGDGITLTATAGGIHRRGVIRDVLLSSASDSTGWGITCAAAEEQADIEISNVTVNDFDNCTYIIYPSQGYANALRCAGNGKDEAGTIGIQIGSTPNLALNFSLEKPYISSYETGYVMYGYVNTMYKPIWEVTYTGIKNYGYTQVYTPYADATTNDIYTYNNAGYGNLVLHGYINQSGGADKLAYETDAVRDRTIKIPMSFGSSHEMRIGPYTFGINEITSNTKIRAQLITANQTLVDNTWTLIVLNDEQLDQNNEFNTTTGLATIGVNGYYLIGGSVNFTTPGDGARLGADIYIDGASTAVSEMNVGAAGSYPSVPFSDFKYLVAGQTVGLWARQITGGPIDVTKGSTSTWMYIVRIL